MRWVFALLIVHLAVFNCEADHWTRKADFPDGGRNSAFSFVIGNKAYVSGVPWGFGCARDLWEFDPALDKWTQKASPSFRCYFPSGMSAGGNGYVFADSANLFWQYSPVTDSWTRKADLPEPMREFAVSFAIGGKIYVGVGSKRPSYFRDFYCYDPAANKWERIADCPEEILESTAFVVNNKAYVAGILKEFSCIPDLLEYDPELNSWTKKANFPGVPRTDASSFTIGNKGYFGFGESSGGGKFKDWWRYDAVADTWVSVAPIPSAAPKDEDPAFSVNFKGYVCFGGDVNHNAEVWEYTPDSVIGANLCPGSTVNFSTDTVAGSWSSSNPDIVTVDPLSGTAKAIKPGTCTIKNDGSMPEVLIVTVASLPSISVSVTNATCYGANNGSILANATGGSRSMQYQWSNDSYSSTLDNLSPGVYTLQVRDNYTQCVTSDSFSINAPDSLTVAVQANSDTCNEKMGNAVISVTGGTPPYRYISSNNVNGNNVTELSAGDYILKVLDANNCQKDVAFAISNRECLNTDIFPNPATKTITITNKEKIRTIAICNLLEQQVYSNRFNSSQIQIDISNLPSAVYFVKINGSAIRKFVKD